MIAVELHERLELRVELEAEGKPHPGLQLALVVEGLDGMVGPVLVNLGDAVRIVGLNGQGHKWRGAWFQRLEQRPESVMRPVRLKERAQIVLTEEGGPYS